MPPHSPLAGHPPSPGGAHGLLLRFGGGLAGMLSLLLENFHFRALEAWRTFGLTSWSPCATTALASGLGGQRARGQRSLGTGLWAAEPGSPPNTLPLGEPGGRQVHHALSFVSLRTSFQGSFLDAGGRCAWDHQAHRPLFPAAHPRYSARLAARRKFPLTLYGRSRIAPFQNVTERSERWRLRTRNKLSNASGLGARRRERFARRG